MSTPAQRSRWRRNISQYRRRQRDGTAVLQVEVPIADVALALLLSGTLTEAEAADRRSVERGAAVVVTRWAREWLAAHGQI